MAGVVCHHGRMLGDTELRIRALVVVLLFAGSAVGFTLGVPRVGEALLGGATGFGLITAWRVHMDNRQRND